MLAARRAVLGDAAAGPPRLLVRVDEFPHAMAWDDPEHFGTARYAQMHEVLRSHGIPYLVATAPHVSREAINPEETRWRHLDPEELRLLAQLRDEGVAFGLHGLDHRTR